MNALMLEVHHEGRWKRLAMAGPGSPPGSISDHHENGRGIYVSQVFADHATLKKLPLGIDAEVGRYRVFDEAEINRAELVKRLELGDSFEIMLTTARFPKMLYRYRYVTMGKPS